MKKRDSQTTRQNILRTAEKVFSEQGFDGARVDRIAEEAEVNKALIYYYFKSKQAILDELIDKFINMANSFLVEIAIKQYEFGSPEMMNLMKQYDDYFLDNENILSLLLTESLKDSYEVPPLFRLIDFQVDGMSEKTIVEEMNERGFNMDVDIAQRKVTEFFTGIMPTIVFSIFRSKWCKHFGVKLEKLDELFRKANDMTHNQHHLNK